MRLGLVLWIACGILPGLDESTTRAQPPAAPASDTANPKSPAPEVEVEKPTDEPSGKPTDKPSDKPSDKPTDKPTDKPSDKPSDKPTDKPAMSVYPLDAVVSSEGDVYIVDRNLPGVWQKRGDEINVLVQGSRRYREPLNAARCLALDRQGRLLIGDSSTREIYRIDDQQKPQPLTGGAIGIPMDIAVRADGSLMVADLETRTLMRVSPDGKEVKTVAKVNPRGVFVDAQDRTWVVSQDAQQLQIVDDEGKSQIIVDKRIFEFPHQVVVNAAGEAFVSDGYKKSIWKVVPGAAPAVVFTGAPLDNPVGLTLVDDQVVITDPRAHSVFRLNGEKCELWFEVPAK